MLLANQIAGFLKILYLKKEVNDEVYFWHADKHQSFLQVDTKIFILRRHVQSNQNKKFAYFCNIFRKMWGIKLIFYL